MRPLPRSLPRICVALGFPTPGELSRAAVLEYKEGNTFLELRLDHLRDPSTGISLIRSFHKRYPDAHILATCRHQQNRGQFPGTLEQQLSILQNAAKAGACVLDLEIESAERAKTALAVLNDSAALIVSHHNFQNTRGLGHVLLRLQRVPAAAYKIATTACKPSDNLRLLQFAREHRAPPLIVLAMSDIGVASRVLGPSVGCLYTYAAPIAGNGTAPGQLSARLMRTLFRCEKLTRQTRIYGIIADPVAHSKSPHVHNRAFQARRLDSVYLPFLVSSSCLKDWMSLATNLPVAGFSVTLPHKQRILRYLDVVEPLAKRIGAVNTVWRRAGKWRGTNTDAEGVLKPLSRQVHLAHASILIAGYGGAARAAAFALADAGAKLSITGRNVKRAHALAQAVRAETVAFKDAQGRHYDALLNATPVGMYPNENDCLFRDVIPASVVLDMVYAPRETLLLRRAKDQGAKAIYGSEMLLEQAASQFEIWTGESAPRGAMQAALEQS
ncbi:MAG: shikimate dehydrogenase [Acidobacteriaceae bacterium]|nr:shikimate dehydrogenase [Acidobacteriaceae bacterium]MBV9779188.1 shikimate dehydrogenase [Acidobacteriaceae bacterium]